MDARIPAAVAGRYRLFSLYNSPYPAHDEGRAVDLYPEPGAAPSPVAGEVLDVRSNRAPPREYAEERDHLILVAATAPDPVAGYTARILHVDPVVDPGDRVAVGEDLGRTIRSGYFAPWVDDHLHVGFREAGDDPYRAQGSVPVTVDVPVEPLAWDGRGTVVETGDTYALLDRPAHPAPGERFAGIAAGRPDAVLDGGFPHYDAGGVIPADADQSGVAPGDGSHRVEDGVGLLGTRVGAADGRTVAWADRRVLVDGEPVHGLSLYVGRDRAGAKVVCPDRSFDPGESVRVSVADGGD